MILDNGVNQRVSEARFMCGKELRAPLTSIIPSGTRPFSSLRLKEVDALRNPENHVGAAKIAIAGFRYLSGESDDFGVVASETGPFTLSLATVNNHPQLGPLSNLTIMHRSEDGGLYSPNLLADLSGLAYKSNVPFKDLKRGDEFGYFRSLVPDDEALEEEALEAMTDGEYENHLRIEKLLHLTGYLPLSQAIAAASEKQS